MKFDKIYIEKEIIYKKKQEILLCIVKHNVCGLSVNIIHACLKCVKLCTPLN